MAVGSHLKCLGGKGGFKGKAKIKSKWSKRRTTAAHNLLEVQVTPVRQQHQQGRKGLGCEAQCQDGHNHQEAGPSQFAHIGDFEEDPAGMWARLKETHQSLGLGGAVVLWHTIHVLCKSDNLSSMRVHIAAIRGLAEKLGRLYDDKPPDAQLIATLLASLPYIQFPRHIARCTLSVGRS
jgi:hypothetical protein